VINLPLIRDYGAHAVFAYRAGKFIGADQFLQDVIQLCSLLPARKYVLNLCSDRYHFAVGFAAAMLRQQISLLPPNHTPDFIEKLSHSYPDIYCLTDTNDECRFMETVFYSHFVSENMSVPEVPSIPSIQVAACVFTSGSSGQPVPHNKSWGGLVRSALAEIERLRIGRYPSMGILGTVPPQHMYGLESTVLMAMQAGGVLHAGRPFYIVDILAELEALPRPRMLVTTPIHLRSLLAETVHFPQVDLLVCATAPLSPQLALKAEASFGAPLYEVYGCTEAGQISTRRTVKTAEWQGFRNITLRQDEKGTWVKGGHVENEILLNDMIELHGNERFLLHGRTEDLVNIAGKRTSLANLNYHLNSIDGVHDGVFVVPELESEIVPRLMAFVVAPQLNAETLMSALRHRIDAAFLPRPICFVESLPRNTTGKLPHQMVNRLVKGFATKVG